MTLTELLKYKMQHFADIKGTMYETRGSKLKCFDSCRIFCHLASKELNPALMISLQAHEYTI